MLTKVMFVWYMVTGVIVPQDDVDGRTVYAIKENKFTVDYAYRGEIFGWIETGLFVYNEDLED